MRILVLDFDGVIVDSMNEGLFTSFNTYIKFNSKTRLFGGEQFTFELFNKAIKKYKSQYLRFKKYRAYLKTALDYYFILAAVDKNAKIRNSEDFDEFKKKVSVDNNRFIDQFYKNRLEYMNNFNEWIKLTPIYPHARAILKRFDKSNTFISTSNRKTAVERTLKHYKIDFDGKNILDNQVSLDKKVHIKIVKESKNVDYKEIIVVDDQVQNLIKVKDFGVKCFLAMWGYNNEEQRKKAKGHGIGLINKDKIEKFIYV